jgi:hypothetical protein
MVDWDYGRSGERTSMLRIPGKGATAWKDYQPSRFPEFDKHLRKYAVDEQTGVDGTVRQFFATDALLDAGFDVITASASRSYMDTPGLPDCNRHLPNCYASARKGVRDAMGTLVTSWAVRRNHPEVGWPAVYAAVLGARSDDPYTEAEVCQAFADEHYGVDVPEFGETIGKACREFGLLCRVLWSSFAHYFGPEDAPADQRRERFAADVAAQSWSGGSCETALSRLSAARSACAEARDELVALKARATRHADNLDYWLEGVDYNTFIVDFLMAALDGSLPGREEAMLDRLQQLRRRTEDLFSRTYRAHGLQDSLETRYGRYERHLQKAVDTGGT